MKTRSLLLGAAASLSLASAANATHVNGYYVSLEGGANWIDDLSVLQSRDPDPAGGAVLSNSTFSVDTGWAVLASVGYGFSGHWRVELEGGYRNNHTTLATDAELQEWSAMINILYDIPLTDRLSLSLGAGAGGDFANLDIPTLSFDEDEWAFAYQGIAGLSYEISDRLDLFANYRYFRVSEPEFQGRAVFPGPAPGTLGAQFDDIVKHTATIGLRYHFGAPAAEPMVAPPPPPPPSEPAAAPKEYIVFFGHNKSNLTPEALDVIKQAAAAAKQYGSSTITVVGHADRSGSPKYNQALSARRAGAVKGALVSEGIADGSISTSAKGETDPMVPTADGVREPQNRRVHINL